MDILILGFMALAVFMCVFTVAVVLRDMRRERKRSLAERVQSKTEQQLQPTAQQSVAVATDGDDQVSFSAEPKQSHKLKYMALDSEQKTWYNEIASYAASVEEVKCVTTGGYVDYRLHSKRIVRMLIKRGTVICEFFIANPNFSRYVSTNKISVKQSATSFKIYTAKDVSAAKDSIDIAVRTVREEREEAKRREKERRRLARQRAARSLSQSATAQVAVQTAATTTTD